MNRTVLGLGVLLGVAGISFAATQLDLGALTRSTERREPVDVAIYFGGEKSALLRNPNVVRVIEDRYAITLDATKAGSIAMATTLDHSGKDCLWPSNAVAVELAREAGKPVQGDETIFNSPIVFFAWADVAEALTSAGAVRTTEDGTLTADIARIEALIADDTRWQEDLGVPVYGAFKIFSTHPAQSNSGNIWSALLATSMNGGETPTPGSLPEILPRITAYFERMGHMEASSGDIFENFLKQGMGARPIIVGYENQLVEFLQQNAEYADLIRDKIRVVYPQPTVFASHPLISLSQNCDRLAEALADPEVQSVAWAQHGFRTGLLGVENDPEAISVAQIPSTIPLVAPMPSATVMAAIIDAVE